MRPDLLPYYPANAPPIPRDPPNEFMLGILCILVTYNLTFLFVYNEHFTKKYISSGPIIPHVGELMLVSFPSSTFSETLGHGGVPWYVILY